MRLDQADLVADFRESLKMTSDLGKYILHSSLTVVRTTIRICISWRGLAYDCAVASQAVARKTRPKDRSETIVQVATKLFCERGFNAVSLDDIGEVVGITGPAVYRHFESKDALLLAVIEQLVARYKTRWIAAVASAETPQARLVALTKETIGAQIEEHHFWPVALAEMRHLPRESVRAIQRNADVSHQIWVNVMHDLHPYLSVKEAAFMVDVTYGLTASLLYYQPQLSKRRLVDVCSRMLLAACQADPFGRSGTSSSDRIQGPVTAALLEAPLRTSARERVLAQAIRMFRQHGFNGIGIDDVAKAAGLRGPAVYNHFRNKENILFAALSRMNEQLAVSVGRSLAGTQSAGIALERLIDSYLDLMIEEPDLMALYWSQRHALAEDERTAIARGERSYIDDWIGVLRHDRYALSEPEARTMIYSALGLMNAYWQAAQYPISLPIDQARPMLRTMAHNALVHA